MDKFKTLDLPNCALCSLPFSTKGQAQFRNIKLPLLLHCGHSACESCLSIQFQKNKDVQCKFCEKVSTVSEDFSSNEISKEFPINHHLAGLWYLKIVTNCGELDSTIKFTTPKLKKKRSSKTIMCNECSENAADYLCKQCGAPYCTPCFKMVHSSAKAFRSHVKMSLLESYLTLDTDRSLMCLVHTKYKLEYYCNSCHTPVCSHCMVESHNGHVIYKIDEVDVDYEEDFIQHFMKASNCLTRMTASKKKAEYILQKDKDISEIKKADYELTKYFILLHGKLSLVENNLRRKLSTNSTRSILEKIVTDLTININDVDQLLGSTRCLLSDETNKVANCLAVLENLKSCQKLPSYLIESEDWKEPRFMADNNFINILENHCNLEYIHKPRYQLVNEENVPSGYEHDSFKSTTREEVINIIRNPLRPSDTSSSCDSERTTSPSISVASDKSYSSQTRDPPNEAFSYADEITIGCSVRVRISHLISPSDFYVQRENAHNKLYDFQASLRPMNVQRSKPPAHPEKGKIYLSLYEADSKWYRARIVDITDIQMYKVIYVDYGNSEIVPRDRLRNIPTKSLNMPFMAYRCQLADCVPRYGESWDPKAVSLMTEIIDNDLVTMRVIDRTSITYIVELYKVTENSFINLRESLSFHELASMTKMFNQTIDISVRQNVTTPQQQQYSIGDILDVHVSHVYSPHHFYCQNLLHSRKLVQLSDDLQKVYNVKNINKNAIYDPKKGMLVAARYSKDSKWYRAKILECLDGKRVNVFFIDFGNEQTVAWENIKLLSQRFGNFPPQAIKCGLCDVMPIDDAECWSEDVCTKLQILIFDKKLRLIVENVENGCINAILYKGTKEYDICLNAVLVKQGLAFSTGVNSTVTQFPRVRRRFPEDNSFQVEHTSDKRIAKKKTTKLTKPFDDSLMTEHFFTMPGGAIRTRVIVKTINNPGEFYVVPTCIEDSIRQLKVYLQEFYGRKRTIDENEWTVDDRCVVNCDGLWNRAIVLDILQDGYIKVILIDEGQEKIVESNSIDIMDPQFTTLQDGVVKCHLGGLEPALNFWSALSISEFEDFVNNRKDSLYIIQLGKIKHSSLPVELFSRTIIDTGPTEPMQDDWKSLNHYLRFIGQAKADGMIEWDSDGQILNINQDSDDCVSILENLINGSLKLNENNFESSASSVEDETKLNTESPEVILITDAWIPAEPLTNLEFVAAPSYVDEDCIVYLHDFHKSEHLLDEISRALGTKYDNSLPRPHDATIEKGDICIAQYHLDKKWYRAQLLEKEEDTSTYKIQFCDYGNIEECKIGELRKVPVAHHIPIQCYKCCFHTLVPVDPSGKWKERHIEIIQYNIVDKNCQIKLVEIPDSNIYGIEKLTLPDGRNFVSELVRQGFALFKDSVNESKSDNSEIGEDAFELTITKPDIGSSGSTNKLSSMLDIKNSSESDEINELKAIKTDGKKKPLLLHWSTILKTLSVKEMPNLWYKEFEIPPVVKSLIVDVSAFLSPLQLVLHVEDVDEDPVVLKMLEDFKELSYKIQIEGPHQRLLSPPYKYKPCCAMFSLDKKWYRGFVMEELANDSLLIQYVDYGNVEVVPCSCVHELKEEWANLEVQGILCKLHNITFGDGVLASDVLQSLQDCFARGAIKAEIMERSPVLEVELYIDEELAYQRLVDLKQFNYNR